VRSSQRKTALVTGATRGIGYELSKLFAQNGYDLVINARHLEDLEEVAAEFEESFGISVHPIARDLSDPDTPEALFEEVGANSLSVDVLVNNAGFGLRGAFAETDLETELRMMRVNMVALTHLTKLFLGGMLERGSGWILNVASTAAYMPGPLMSVYYATKAYVLSFTEALASELEGSGVGVTVLCPGPTKSQFKKRAKQREIWLRYLLREMAPERVARAGFRAVERGRRLALPSLQDWLVVFFHRFVPRPLLANLVHELHKRREVD